METLFVMAHTELKFVLVHLPLIIFVVEVFLFVKDVILNYTDKQFCQMQNCIYFTITSHFIGKIHMKLCPGFISQNRRANLNGLAFESLVYT